MKRCNLFVQVVIVSVPACTTPTIVSCRALVPGVCLVVDGFVAVTSERAVVYRWWNVVEYRVTTTTTNSWRQYRVRYTSWTHGCPSIVVARCEIPGRYATTSLVIICWDKDGRASDTLIPNHHRLGCFRIFHSCGCTRTRQKLSAPENKTVCFRHFPPR